MRKFTITLILIVVSSVIFSGCSSTQKLNRITKRLDRHLDKYPELREAFDTTVNISTDSTNVSLLIDSTLMLEVDEEAVADLVEMIREEAIVEAMVAEETPEAVEETPPLTRRIVKAITNEVLKDKEFNLDIPVVIDAPDTLYTDTLNLNLTYSDGKIHVNGNVNLDVESNKTQVDITYKEFSTFWLWLKDEKTLFLIAIIVILVFAIVAYFYIKSKL